MYASRDQSTAAPQTKQPLAGLLALPCFFTEYFIELLHQKLHHARLIVLR